MEECGGGWRSVEGGGGGGWELRGVEGLEGSRGVWRDVEECGEVWRDVEGLEGCGGV